MLSAFVIDILLFYADVREFESILLSFVSTLVTCCEGNIISWNGDVRHKLITLNKYKIYKSESVYKFFNR